MSGTWVWLPVLLLSLTTDPSSANQLRVSPSPCNHTSSSLNQTTLDEAIQVVGSNDVIYLEDGEHCIRNFSRVFGLRNVSIVGQSRNSTFVRCNDGLGLAFVNISGLSIDSLTIDGCGLTGPPLNETVDQLSQILDLFIEIPDASTVAVILGQVQNLSVEKVTVKNTPGVGLIGVNVIGDSLLRDVEFSSNIRPAACLFLNVSDILGIIDRSPQLLGGGAIFLYHDYLSEQESSALLLRKPRVLLDDVTFIGNSECTFSLALFANFPYSMAIQRAGYIAGGGAGLTLTLAQLHYGVDFTVRSSLFQNNTARYGGGAAVEIFTAVGDTYVGFDGCSFLRNGFSIQEIIADTLGSFTAAGGGVAIVQEIYRPGLSEQPLASHSRDLQVDFLNSNFTANGAHLGGAVVFFGFPVAGIRSFSDASRLLFNNCTFTLNSGSVGAAMWMVDNKLNGRTPGPFIELRDVRLELNTARPLNSTITTAQDNAAVVDVRGLNVSISGTSYFRNNLGTALQASGSLIAIAVNATVYFERNSGVFGGGMTFLFYSYLILNTNSSLYLRENVGKSRGGAFYVNLLGSNNVAFFDDCFLYFNYNDFTVCDEECADLNSTGVYVEFLGNSAAYGGSASYGSSLQYCPWAVQLRVQGYDDGTVFRTLSRYFPSVFNFSEAPVTAEVVGTPPRQLVIHNPQTLYSVVPGGVFSLNVTTLDGLNNPISNVLQSYVLTVDGESNVDDIRNTTSFLGSGFAFLPDRAFQTTGTILSTVNHTVSLVVTSIDCQSLAQQEVVVEVGLCPTGFVFNTTLRICECDQRLVDEGVTCSIRDLTIAVPDDHWLGPISEGSTELVVASCIEEYCSSGTRYISVQEEPINYDVQCTNGTNRGGFLCGRCRRGYSLALGSERCLKCNNGYTALIVVFLALGVLLVAMISYLRITLTAGYINGILFYSNIVSLFGTLLVPVNPHDGRLALTSFLTLNLGIETCFHDGMTALEKLWWQLSFPLYLVFLMLLIRGFGRCCKWKRGAGFYTIQGIATLTILCYVSVLESCVELLGFVTPETLSGNQELRWIVDPTVTYFQGVHGFLAFVAICLLIVYIIPLPLFLLFPQVLYRIRFFRNFKPFYDAFWNPFEPRFRFWLGLRLICRWIPYALVFLQPAPQNLFGTALVLLVLEFFQLLLRPLQGFWRNLSDGYFLLNLIILFLGSVYFRSLDADEEERDRFMEQATRFSTAFIILAYLGFAAVLCYHIIVRFPRLQQALKRLVEMRGKKKEVVYVPQSINSEREPPTVSKPTESVTTYTELREPLLESEGSLEIVTLSAPTRNTT